MANTLKVKLEGTNVLTQGVLNGIDTSNVLATIVNTGGSSESGTFSYTATQDCFVTFFAQGGNSVSISGTQIDCLGSGNSVIRNVIVPLKKGQTFSFYGNTASKRAYVFGVKR